MGKRAELRRKAKEEKRKKATYNMSKEQLEKVVNEEVFKKIDELRSELYGEALRDTFIMALDFCLITLKNNYWKDSFQDISKGFVDDVIHLYEEWVEDRVDPKEVEKELWDLGGVKIKGLDK